MPELKPIGVVYTTRNADGEHNTILVYARPYGFKVLEGPAVSVKDPIMDTLDNNGLKRRVTEACERLS